VVVALAMTLIYTTTVQATAYTPSPEACALAHRNCLNPANPTMGTGLPPFVGAAACSYDLPLGTVLRVQQDANVSYGDAAFNLPRELICLDRFGRPTRGRRIDIVLLYPNDPGSTELNLARAWGVRQLEVEVYQASRPWREIVDLFRTGFNPAGAPELLLPSTHD
jgi:3D (Asp-Asp-Asp) domain-containing protein